jgi:hypothetical protein
VDEIKVRPPGFEPEFEAWEASVLTTRLWPPVRYQILPNVLNLF